MTVRAACALLCIPVVLAFNEQLPGGHYGEPNPFLFSKEVLSNGTERLGDEPAWWSVDSASAVCHILAALLGLGVLYAHVTKTCSWGAIAVETLWRLDAFVTITIPALCGRINGQPAAVITDTSCPRTAPRRARARKLHKGKRASMEDEGDDEEQPTSVGALPEFVSGVTSDIVSTWEAACTWLSAITNPRESAEGKAWGRSRGGRNRARAGKGKGENDASAQTEKCGSDTCAEVTKAVTGLDEAQAAPVGGEADEDVAGSTTSDHSSSDGTSSPESSEEPTDSGEEPLDSSEEPIVSGEEPIDSGEEPLDSSEEPVVDDGCEEALGEQLYPLVCEVLDLSHQGLVWRQPGDAEEDCMAWAAAKVTGMLLENDQAMVSARSALLCMLVFQCSAGGSSTHSYRWLTATLVGGGIAGLPRAAAGDGDAGSGSAAAVGPAPAGAGQPDAAGAGQRRAEGARRVE